MVNTLSRSEDDFSSELDRRARLHRRARLAVLAAVVGYFFLPYEVQAVIPVWLLFLAALGLEVEFFVGGWLKARQGVEPAPVDRGPQPRDLEELGAQYDEYEPLSLFPSDWYSEPAETAPHRQWRYIAEAALGLAVVAVVLYFAVRPSGWDAVSSANQAKAETVFSREASQIAGHPAQVTCDDSGRQVGYVQDADGVAEVGGRQAYLTPVDLRHPLPARVQGPGAVVPAHGARDRSARARGAASERRAQRGPGELLRLPERRRASASTSASRKAGRGR